MGCMKKGSFDSGVPDMSKYTILEWVDIGGYCLLKIKYHNCTNYNGVKLLLYPWNYGILQSQGCTFDPHFNAMGMSPFARFEPTSFAWDRAIMFAEML